MFMVQFINLKKPSMQVIHLRYASLLARHQEMRNPQDE
jgi:hypothetical protein